MFTRALIVLLLVLNVGVAAWWALRAASSAPVVAQPESVTHLRAKVVDLAWIDEHDAPLRTHRNATIGRAGIVSITGGHIAKRRRAHSGN